MARFVACRIVLRAVRTGLLLGHAPTGRTIEVTGAEPSQIAEGRFAESWLFLDSLGLNRQVCPPA